MELDGGPWREGQQMERQGQSAVPQLRLSVVAHGQSRQAGQIWYCRFSTKHHVDRPNFQVHDPWHYHIHPGPCKRPNSAGAVPSLADRQTCRSSCCKAECLKVPSDPRPIRSSCWTSDHAHGCCCCCCHSACVGGEMLAVTLARAAGCRKANPHGLLLLL